MKAQLLLTLTISFFAIAFIWFFKQGKAICEKKILEQEFIKKNESLRFVRSAKNIREKNNEIIDDYITRNRLIMEL